MYNVHYRLQVTAQIIEKISYSSDPKKSFIQICRTTLRVMSVRHIADEI